MYVTDPIADRLTRLRNGAMARHVHVEIPTSTMTRAVVEILKDEGFIKDYDLIKGTTWDLIRVELKWFKDRTPGIAVAKRVSRPGRRVYVGVKDVPKVRNGLGIAIMSTPKGVMTDKGARKLNVGGEWLCSLW
jgi:small subunit ribosomal protein S8